jgi:hypothetical protein
MVDSIRIECEVALDAGDRRIGRLVGPHRIDRALTAHEDAEIRGVPFVGQ